MIIDHKNGFREQRKTVEECFDATIKRVLAAVLRQWGGSNKRKRLDKNDILIYGNPTFLKIHRSTDRRSCAIKCDIKKISSVKKISQGLYEKCLLQIIEDKIYLTFLYYC